MFMGAPDVAAGSADIFVIHCTSCSPSEADHRTIQLTLLFFFAQSLPGRRPRRLSQRSTAERPSRTRTDRPLPSGSTRTTLSCSSLSSPTTSHQPTSSLTGRTLPPLARPTALLPASATTSTPPRSFLLLRPKTPLPRTLPPTLALFSSPALERFTTSPPSARPEDTRSTRAPRGQRSPTPSLDRPEDPPRPPPLDRLRPSADRPPSRRPLPPARARRPRSAKAAPVRPVRARPRLEGARQVPTPSLERSTSAVWW